MTDVDSHKLKVGVNKPKRHCRLFSDLPYLSPWTLSYLQSKSYTILTPVQDTVIPLLLTKKKDVVVEACTGSGKTLAYLIPLLESVSPINEEPLDDGPRMEEDGDVGSKLVRGSMSRKFLKVDGLIIAPTRELCCQIYEVLTEYLGHVPQDGRQTKKIKAFCIRGGKEVNREKQTLLERRVAPHLSHLNANIIIGTPGRLGHMMDLMKQHDDWDFRSLSYLILDEADRLIELEFVDIINRVIGYMPRQRQTCLCSATMNTEIKKLIRIGMRNHTLVRILLKTDSKNMGVEKNTPMHTLPSTLENFYMVVENDQKLHVLLKLLRSVPKDTFPPLYSSSERTHIDKTTHTDKVLSSQSPPHKYIIFCLTCACVNFWYLALKKMFGDITNSSDTRAQTFIPLHRLHGKMKPTARVRSYHRFRNADRGILVATDIMARGIDIPDVDWVIQLDPPQDPSFYVHRVGRVARAGRQGKSLTLITPSEEAFVDFIRNRGICISEMDTGDLTCKVDGCQMDFASSAYYCLSLLKDKILKDRALLNSATMAFVTYVRAYKEYKLQYILPISGLNIGRLASALALLRIPRIKEILGRKIPDFEQSPIDPLDIPYIDNNMEERRREGVDDMKSERDNRKKRRLERKQFWNKYTNRKRQRRQISSTIVKDM